MTFNCTTPKLFVVSNLILGLFKQGNPDLTGLKYTSLLYDASQDYGKYKKQWVKMLFLSFLRCKRVIKNTFTSFRLPDSNSVKKYTV